MRAVGGHRPVRLRYLPAAPAPAELLRFRTYARRSGNAHPNIAPYDSYRTGTEPIFLAVGNDRQFARLCEYLGADELPGDPRFADNGKRSVNREALKRALEDYLAAHDGRELAERLIRLGVPCGAIATVDRVVEHPHTRHRGMVVELERAIAASPRR